MTLIEAIDAARYLLNEPLESTRTFPDNTSSFWTDAVLRTYFNLVQEEVQNEIIQVFEDYFVTQTYVNVVNGTAEYTIPSGCVKVRRVEDNRDVADPVEITPVTLNNRGTRTSILKEDKGHYYLRGNQIVLTDTPTYTNASAIRLHYVKKLGDLSASTEVSEIPVEYHRVFTWGIVKHALFQQQSDTTVANAEFEKQLLKIRQQAENRQIQRPRRVVQSIERRYR